MAVEHYENEFINLVKKRQLKFLHAAGNIGVNQTVQNMNVDTGLARNSIIYRLFSGVGSNFGNLPGRGGSTITPKDDISNPTDPDLVRVGGNLEYLPFLEKRFGIFAGSLDDIIRPLNSLIKKVFKT